MTEMSSRISTGAENFEKATSPLVPSALEFKIEFSPKAGYSIHAQTADEKIVLPLGPLSSYPSVNQVLIKSLLIDLEQDAKQLGAEGIATLLATLAKRNLPVQELSSRYVSPGRPEFEEIKDASSLGSIPAVTICYRGRVGARAVVSVATSGAPRGRLDTFDRSGRHLYAGLLFGQESGVGMALLQEVHLFIARGGGFPSSKEDMKDCHLKTVHLPLNPKGDADKFATKFLEAGPEPRKPSKKRLLGLF